MKFVETYDEIEEALNEVDVLCIAGKVIISTAILKELD